MKLILQENYKTAIRSAILLICCGIVVCIIGLVQHNNASVFFGASFSLLSVVCFFLVRNDHFSGARVLWGLISPVLLFLSPLLFGIGQPVAIITYGYMYIAGMMYVAYSFQQEYEKWPMWISIALFLGGMMTYDKIIIEQNFQGESWASALMQHYGYFKIIQAFHFFSLLALILMIKNNKASIEQKMSNQITRLEDLTNGLITISQNHMVHSDDLFASLKELLVFAAKTIDVSRISIWEFDEDKNSICAILCYDSQTKEFTESGILNKCDFPLYFKYLLEEKMINAYDAVKDEKTHEFAASYLIPNGIKSMMDSPFFIDGKFKGILCYEEQRSFKKWDEVDELYSMAISKLISIAYYCHMRKQQFDVLKLTNETLAIKNETLESINKKVMEMNDDLAHNMLSQDQGIEELNKFIDDISFRNSHHIRAPLSRILGLVKLYRYEQDQEGKALYIDYIEKSAAELDFITRDIAKTLRNSRRD